jgi:hypothetical protein
MIQSTLNQKKGTYVYSKPTNGYWVSKVGIL